MTIKLPQKKYHQHYVWKHYLTAWTINNLICCFRKPERKFFKANPTGVGQQRNFYKIKKLTDFEYKFTEALIRYKTPKELLDINLYYLTEFQKIFKIQKVFEKNGCNDDLSSELFDILITNIPEDYHCLIEQDGIFFIESLLKEDASFYMDIDKRNCFFYYLMNQYTRTKKMSNSIIQQFADDNRPFKKEINIENIWSVLRYVFATKLACSSSNHHPSELIILKNNTNINFITCDQPVINLKANDLDDQGMVKELEFYYPLSPKIAIIIKDSTEYKYSTLFPTPEKIDYLNEFIFTYAEEQVFSIKKEDIEKHITNHFS